MSKSSTTSSRSSNPGEKTFLCGVCEGFYGKPWTSAQRRELYGRMRRMGMQTYLYAPKDDYKHRLYWRSLYDDDEADELQELILAAREHGVTFVYALSPGLDITYSSHADRDLLKKKLNQVRSFGCESFALLFDDIESDLVPEDSQAYESVGAAQADITNEAYSALGGPGVFLFCPTEYCTSRASPDLVKSEYLQVLGEKLDKGIDILWTGPKVVSRRITIAGIKELSKLIQRPPVIWDNIHANDYDQTRLFLGPYDGRATELRHVLRGVLTNPNCEFEANFVAMHTLAQWSKNRTERYPPLKTPTKQSSVDGTMDTDGPSPVIAPPARYSVHGYSPKRALVCAVEDWLPELYRKKREYRGHRRRADDEKRDVASMETDQPQRSKNTKNATMKKKMEELEPLSVEDLLLVCDLFYLPYEHGTRAFNLLKTAHWLISNASRVANAQKIPKEDHSPEVREWYDKAISFHERHKDLCLVVDKLVNIPNRDLLYQLYVYMGDVRSCLSLVNSYIKWHGMGKVDKEPFRRGEQEPWVHRSGLYGEFRRLLPLEGQNDSFPAPGKLTSGNRVFTIRPYLPEDKSDVYLLCRRCCDDRVDGSDLVCNHPDLVAEESVGCLLAHSPRTCFVLEDDAGICGYIAATPDITEYRQTLETVWYPAMRDKYPALSTDGETDTDQGENTAAERALRATFHRPLPPLPSSVLPSHPAYAQVCVSPGRVEGLTTPSRLVSACLQTLKAAGVSGVHTTIRHGQGYALSFLCKLSFVELAADDGSDDRKEEVGSEGKRDEVTFRTDLLWLGRVI